MSFVKGEPVPEALRIFLGLCLDVQLPRTEIAKQIYMYVRDKNLRDKSDRRIFHPDKTLQKLFSLKDGETLDFKNFQKYLSRHYTQSISNVNNEKKTVKFAEDVKENCNSNKDDDKGWSDLEESEDESEEELEEELEEESEDEDDEEVIIETLENELQNELQKELEKEEGGEEEMLEKEFLEAIEDAEESDNEEEGWTDLDKSEDESEEESEEESEDESEEESEEEIKKEIKKDYSILSNLFEDKTNEIEEKEIEEKYSEFLDWLQKDWISKYEYYTIISEKYNKCIPNNYIDLKCDIDNKLLKYLKKRYFEIRGCRGQYCCNKSCSLNVHIDINPIIINKITNLEKTNQDILKKLEEQIQLNSKLCQRIFEMKEEKFKDEKS